MDKMRTRLRSRETWKRGVFLLVFAFVYSLAELLVLALALFQFASVLLTAAPNARLLDFGRQLSAYMYELIQFFTFTRDQRPYPFAPWPTPGARSGSRPGPRRRKKPPARRSAAREEPTGTSPEGGGG